MKTRKHIRFSGIALRSLILLIVFILTSAVPAFPASSTGIVDYTDVGRYAKIRTAVDWANVSGILRGPSKGTFSPNASLSRGALLKALWRMAGRPQVSASLPFRDRASMSAEARQALSWAYSKGIVNSGTYFKASNAATRQWCAVCMYRFARLRGCDMSPSASLGGYSDASSLSETIKTAFKWSVKTGTVPSASSGRLNPTAAVRRSEGIKMLYRLHQLIPSYLKKLGKPKSWNQLVLREIAEVENFGGYYLGGISGSPYGTTTFRAMNAAFTMSGSGAKIDMSKARPSFCSSACYMLLLKTISDYNGSSIGSSAWTALRPYTVSGLRYPIQEDGVGCWGRANANGPGMAVLIKKIGAGKNVYIGNRSEYSSDSAYWNVWANAKPGDFLKIFRTGAIGASERGHMVVYLGSKYATSGGRRDDIIYYWSSAQGSAPTETGGGYGIDSCRASAVYRGVLTKITKPSAFSRASSVSPTNRDNWLGALLQKNVTAADMKKHI